ncbi:MAG TPA: cation:proton antiporter [Candidatus Aenigmarchaeota archaeon]|nr:MAG: cation:proton antiporter [Candidatus Aenigmarchaeota archaeon]HDD46411.1 cation:proton antiporter [Candidatus Aenigmarchaeota archaeon]
MILYLIISIILSILALLCWLKVIISRTIVDKMVALDAANTIVISFLILLGAIFKEIVYVDVAIVYAMLSFVSIIYISRYLEGCK